MVRMWFSPLHFHVPYAMFCGGLDFGIAADESFGYVSGWDMGRQATIQCTYADSKSRYPPWVEFGSVVWAIFKRNENNP